MGTTANMTANRTVLGEDANLSGRVVGENIMLLGRFEGNIEATGQVHTSERSRVKARLVAREVTVAGEFEGEVRAQRLCFGPQARARGRFAADSLAIADGASVDGAFNLGVPPTGAEEPLRDADAASASSDLEADLAAHAQLAAEALLAG